MGWASKYLVYKRTTCVSQHAATRSQFSSGTTERALRKIIKPRKTNMEP